MSELIDELTALQQRLFREEINALVALAKQPSGTPLTANDLSRIANIHTVLEAVRAELAARLPREGWAAGDEPDKR